MVGRRLRRQSSVSSFGNKLEKGNFDAASQASFASAPYTTAIKGLPIVKRKKRVSCARHCCRSLIAVAVLAFIGTSLFAAAVFSSRPGYDKRTQDSNSAPTRNKIQEGRARVPAFVAKLQSVQPSVTKQELVDHIQRASAFSAAAYVEAQNCPSPVGANLSRTLSSKLSKGFIARDDTAQQIVVAFKGFTGPRDLLNGIDVAFQQLDVAGRVLPGAQVQKGFQEPYKTIERQMLDTVNSELMKNNNYSILVTGHTTGAPHAVLAALALKATFPNNFVMCVTQGQSRTFNQAGADFIDQEFTPSSLRMIRAVHTLDGLPTVKAPYVNKDSRHHSGEIWQFRDPAEAENIVVCRGQEDPLCSSSNPTPAIQAIPPALPYDAETLHYFDIEMNSDRSVECGGSGGILFHNIITSRGTLKNAPSAETIARTFQN